jgi:hypothetical protein
MNFGMKQISYICLLILIYLICSSDGCTEDASMREIREEKLIVAIKDTVKSVFETDTLSARFMRAYEETAQQKLIDFADYMKIVSDTSLDNSFRQQAADMVSKLFISDEVDIQGWSKFHYDSKPGTLGQLLENAISQGMTTWIQPYNIEVMTPLSMENDSTISGTLSFYQKRVPFDDKFSADSINKPVVIDFFVMRKVKLFGREQLRIWEVFLGDIE